MKKNPTVPHTHTVSKVSSHWFWLGWEAWSCTQGSRPGWVPNSGL